MNKWMFVALLIWIAEVLPTPSRAAEPDPEVDRAFAAYSRRPDLKAFAIAVDADGNWAYGECHAQDSQSAAVQEALRQCERARKRWSVAAPCEILAVGDTRVRAFRWPESAGMKRSDRGPSAPVSTVAEAETGLESEPEKEYVVIEVPGVTDKAQSQNAVRHTIEYESRWVEGANFVVGRTPELQVWVSFSHGSDTQAAVYLVNGSSRSITFAPESITAVDVHRKGSRQIRSSLETFSAAGYERKVRNKQAWQAALFAAAASLNNQPQPRTSTFSGEYSTYQPFHLQPSYYGSYSGQITTWPTAADYVEANERKYAQLRQMGDQLARSYTALTQSLLQTHTLDPRTFHGGVVHFSRSRAELVELSIPFGGTVFRANFSYSK